MNAYSVLFIDAAFMELTALNIVEACMIHSIEKGDSNSFGGKKGKNKGANRYGCEDER